MKSISLIQFIGVAKYNAFYGCTHRCYSNLRWGEFINDSIKSRRTINLNEKTIFTYYITESLIKATGLTCLAVSTPDDFSDEAFVTPSKQCGFGYENILKPWEIKTVQKNKENALKKKTYVLSDYPVSKRCSVPDDELDKLLLDKNQQLLSIAQHARLQYPDATLELHYLDDLEELCLEILNIPLHKLPLDVSIQSFQHYPAKNIFADIENPLATISNVKKTFSTAFSLYEERIKSQQHADTISGLLSSIRIAYDKIQDKNAKEKKSCCGLFKPALIPLTIHSLPKNLQLTLQKINAEYDISLKKGMEILDLIEQLVAIKTEYKRIQQGPSSLSIASS
jgi:hypothetical protein